MLIQYIKVGRQSQNIYSDWDITLRVTPYYITLRSHQRLTVTEAVKRNKLKLL